jgi:hypothetical protein
VLTGNCHPNLRGKLRSGGQKFQASLGKNQDPISKITRAKSAGGITQAVQHLPKKCEALSSNPSTIKNKIYFVSVSVSVLSVQITELNKLI